MTKTRSKTKSAKASRPAASTSRRRAARGRAWHVRISLHPLSLFALLSVGVMLTASTISAFGDSYQVTATVQDIPPADPAIITSPADGTHLTNQTTAVTGTCPAGAYTILTLNGSNAGSSDCAGGAFSVTVSLQAGANSLSAQDYNQLNLAGPTSSGSTIYYDQANTTQETPVVPPQTLIVQQVDTSVPYTSQSAVPVTTPQPTFQGVAPPFSFITLLIHSDPVYCHTQADAQGFWSCTLTSDLPEGNHTVVISAITQDGKTLTLPLFHFQVVNKKAAAAPTTPPLAISAPTYHYQVYTSGQNIPLQINIGGGSAPYAISVDWGDGKIQTYSSKTAYFKASHKYGTFNASLKAYPIKVEIIDSHGNRTTHQYTAYVRNPHFIGSGSAKLGGFNQLLSSMHNWLWLLWPSYSIILLMLISFWLGERRQYERDSKPGTRKRKKVTQRTRHA